ncbi:MULTISPECIES: cytochrome b/b6 domain-containing protein [unclassified Polaromonas]|jgi:cytochrome b|uniref:cytochrome b/b6 domain-containing protein n=1 Tax=unclassified Polaromonas TaxID=2638319 RepID=UPI000BDD017F|nr:MULTISPECIES: cytochrome b/b6 domain-containing protein [unclassified Polaromonas]OYY33067.1 MAG: cytochrome B [Polaromonas sp. 35-63-35]OYZ17246.1 MAG: cytochrome B [Polaromonas sp. 16-63-31]OYZ76498.1 MAG: cytochrome B [Polaromonas sp. 24-63-21]OZA47556.1 MAG: cytochrome B [Polaromonas sp. 17-63-33]OZA85637.1 MAG: cytochrome B [Polaromonas sp. 39-63-25]
MSQHIHKIRVWDLPTRLFHWALVAAVIGLAVTGTIGGNAMVWHFRFGYSVLTLLLFRIVWGLVGGRWSRFGAFIYSPASVINYLKGKGRPEHGIGHSPVGAGSVFAMLGFLLAQVGTGLLSDDEIAFAGPLTRFVSNATVGLATDYHKNIGRWILLALVVLHIGAIVFYLWRKHNLVGAMLHGDKVLVTPAPASRDDTTSRLLALGVLLVCAAGVYWISSLGAPAF